MEIELSKLKTLKQVHKKMEEVFTSKSLKFYEKESYVKQLQAIAKVIETELKNKKVKDQTKSLDLIKVVYVNAEPIDNSPRVERLEKELDINAKENNKLS